MDQDKYQRAKARVEDLKGFYTHLLTYIGVNLLLIAIDLLTGRGLWFYWVTVFWGLGVILQAIKVFFGSRLFSKDWEERKIREIMEKEEK